MYTVKQLLFNMEGESVASETSESWMDVIQSTPTGDEEQLETDSEPDVLEETAPESEQEEQKTVDEGEPETEEKPAFDEDTEISLGDDRQPVKLRELKDGYLRQSDYTKKLQDLSNQRSEVEKLQEEITPTKQWMDYIQSNPWVFQQINLALQEFQNTGALPIDEVLADQQYGKYINHLMSENTKLQKEVDRINGEYEGVKLSSELTSLKNDLKAEYGDLVTDDYMESLQERGKTEKLSSTTLKEIADGYLAKQKMQQSKTNVKTATKQAAAKAVQDLQETRNRAPMSPKSTGQKPGSITPDESGMSWFDIAKQSFQK